MTESPSYTLHKLVFTLDWEAHKIVKEHVGISYKRALFLIVLRTHGSLTQHQLATKLGYSDAAVSLMLKELKEADYIIISPSPRHKRKNDVYLTAAGEALSKKASEILDDKFALLGKRAGVDLEEYARVTEQLYRALTDKESGGRNE